MPAASATERAQELLRDSIVCDLLVPWQPNFPQRWTRVHRMQALGYGFASFSTCDDYQYMPEMVSFLSRERARLDAQPDVFMFAGTADDIRRAKAEGRIAYNFDFQGTNVLQTDLTLVATFHRLGLRRILLAYNQVNTAAGGCNEREDVGLSKFGLALIAEMERVGVMLDVTHVGYRASMQAMEAATKPVIFSHSNACALHDVPRNIRDDQIRACAASGGVVGITGLDCFLGPDRDISAELFVRHIDYVAELVGPEHVALGLDYCGEDDMLAVQLEAEERPLTYTYTAETLPKFMPPERLPQIVEQLLRSGHSPDDVRGILGENFLRVAAQVW